MDPTKPSPTDFFNTYHAAVLPYNMLVKLLTGTDRTLTYIILMYQDKPTLQFAGDSSINSSCINFQCALWSLYTFTRLLYQKVVYYKLLDSTNISIMKSKCRIQYLQKGPLLFYELQPAKVNISHIRFVCIFHVSNHALGPCFFLWLRRDSNSHTYIYII